MVDFNLEMQKIRPINIKEIELKRYIIDDNAKKSIILYNAAIGDIKKGDINLAITDLKKALSYNKDFTEAIKLMGLCYATMKEYKKAEKTFKKLNKYEVFNELANEYIQGLSIQRSIPDSITITEEFGSVSNNLKKQYGVVKKTKRNLTVSLVIILVVITGVSISYFYRETSQSVLTIFETSIQSVQEKFQTKNNIDESNKKIDKNLEKDESLAEDNTISSRENEDTQKKIEDTKSETDNLKNNTESMLNDAERLLNDGNYEKGASILISMKNMNLDDGEKIKFNELWQSLKLNPLWTIYNDGNKLYKQNKYVEALPKLLIASEIDPSLDIMPWITFQIGMCYKATNDNTNARVYFNKVKDNYPQSQYVSNARMMISEIGN